MTPTKMAALVYIEREDGAVLCVWNRKHLCWGLPGGKVETGESPRGAAARELYEETGLLIPEWDWPLEPIDTSPTYASADDPGRYCYTFRPKVSDDLPEPRTHEIGAGIGWMTREFLCAEPKTGAWFRKFFAASGRHGK